MTEGNIDFGRAARTRAVIARRVAPHVDSDIARALSRADVPDALLSRPFDAVTDLEELAGPCNGTVDVPSQWHATLPTRLQVADRPLLLLLYQQVLLGGDRVQQQQVLNSQLLIRMWPVLADQLPAAVVQVWEGRFPVLGRDGAS